MKDDKKGLIIIFGLICIIIILVVILGRNTLKSVKKKEPDYGGSIEKIEIEKYPNVNDECIFNVSANEYHNLSSAGCIGGYTRYNINDIKLNQKTVNVSIIYSDKNQTRTGIYINDVKMTKSVDDITNIKFGIFDNKLFIFDSNNKENNVLSFNSKGKKIYDLKEILNKHNVKNYLEGDTYIKTSDLEKDSFSFYEGGFEFSTLESKCENGKKGAHYKVTYIKEKFETPEFINLIDC